MARKLRIAVSVLFGGLAVALVIWWVQSYWTIHWVRMVPSTKRITSLHSLPGQLAVQAGSEPNVYATRGWTVGNRPAAEVSRDRIGGTLGFCFESYPGGYLVVIPYWCPSVAVAAFAVLPWLPLNRRFSLRALLVAMTLVATMLGLGVWLGVNWLIKSLAVALGVIVWLAIQGGFIPSMGRGNAVRVTYDRGRFRFSLWGMFVGVTLAAMLLGVGIWLTS